MEKERQYRSDAYIAELNARYAGIIATKTARWHYEEQAFRKREALRGYGRSQTGERGAMPHIRLLVYLWLHADPAVVFMYEKQAKFRHFMQRHTKVLAACLGGVVLAAVLWFTAIALLPQTIQFGFTSSHACVTSPALFPGLAHGDSQGVFIVSRPASVSFGHVAIFAWKLCASPVKGPRAQHGYAVMETWGSDRLHLRKRVSVKTKQYADTRLAAVTTKDMGALPLLRPMQFVLSDPDSTFDYYMASGGKRALCSKTDRVVQCGLTPLGLSYGSKYRLDLIRAFHGQKISGVLSANVTTVTAAAVAAASVGQGSIVYDTPQSITLAMSKKLVSVKDVTLSYQANNMTTVIPVTVKVNGQTVTVAYNTMLPRQTGFKLRVANVTAEDGSQLEQPYELAFATSGGPKVTGINIAGHGVVSNTAIVISFDQPLLSSQSPALLASLNVNGATAAVTATIKGNTITLIPLANYPKCAHLNVTVTNGVQSQYGISGNSAWNYTARSLCYTAFSIGTSVQGRPMTAYQFGSGSTMILYIGAMHGNEQNTMYLLQKWIAALDAEPDSIPSSHSVVIIPAINPDGVAGNFRVNAHNVDLNRNFPSNDWQTVVTEPDSNGAPTNDGGPTPLSEPESQALASYVQAKRPRLILTYHSHAGIVEANDAADSDALGTLYGASSGYRSIPTYAIGNTFDYSTSGAFEDWANQKLGIPALVVELLSSTNDEYSRNQNAMWSMAKLQ